MDLSVIQKNLRRFRLEIQGKTRGGPAMMFVVKADAYGHGAVACARAASSLVDWLGVSCVEEGIILREAGVNLPILVLGSLYPFESFLASAEYGLTPTVASLESAKRLLDAARRLERRLSCHLKIDVGMGRIGLSPATAAEAARFICAEPLLKLAGAYAHFSGAESDAALTRVQLGRLLSGLKGFPRLPHLIVHAANSAAALKHPAARLDLVRPGGAIYGLACGFEPALSLKSRLVFIKTVGAGSTISYGPVFRASKTMRVATLPIGYADGFSRDFSNRGFVLVGGRRCRVLGRVTMDMTMIDVSSVPEARVGDEAVLIGRQGSEKITAEDWARELKTIPYEAACSLSARVPRVHLLGGMPL